jgi:homoserine/homoserine lactone efflux protein
MTTFDSWTISLPEGFVKWGGTTSIQAGWSLFLQGFAVNSANSQALVFYLAFFSPFMALLPQLLIMSLTFITILVLISYLYALLAARTQTWFSGMKQASHWQNRITGLLLVLAEVILMATSP